VKDDSIIETLRLKLRPYHEEDIDQMLPLIGAREVAVTTLRIPHPYTEKDAREFIAATRQGNELRRAIILRNTGRLIGGVGLNVEDSHSRAELGYWIGVPYWGQGYATEASLAMLRYGFERLRLNRIFASHFAGNEASARVLKKLGMRFEGSQRDHIRKWDRFIDLELYGMLLEEWSAGQSSKPSNAGPA
jgi:[ribosomal protein S5]-alanine N-acetyltransferase